LGGVTPHIVDLNRLYYQYLRSSPKQQGDADFCTYVCNSLDGSEFDVFGLSTICSSYPLTLRIAREVKCRHPAAVVVLGGPQASVVDQPTMEAFPCVDYIVRGEAEQTFPALLDMLARDGSPEGLAGLTFRRSGSVIRNPAAPVITDLDSLPTPAFHLYGNLGECRYVPLELGRGCPFGCTFCSTNDFFRRRFRLKSPQRVIQEMRQIRDTYKINTFDLIHDMFTVDHKRVAAFCQAILDSGEEFYWNCSARTDCIDDELIGLMSKAGCKGIFFGIETGSARLQKIIKKNLDLEEAIRHIECNDKHQIATAVSLITCFPQETMDDLRDTVRFLADSLRFDYAQPQLHLLAPLAETPLHSLHRQELILDDVMSDMSYQGWRQDPVDREMIQAHADIFPNFYSIPTAHLDRRYVKEFATSC